MPLPMPHMDESNADFMGRCMSEIKGEFPDQKQRVAVCMSQWRKKETKMAELVTETLADVPIMRAGAGFHGTGCPPEGCEFTIGDLDAIIDAYWTNKDVLKPPVKLGHDENQALLQSDGYPSAGFVGNLRRRADKLYADFLNVPKAVADVIRAGAYHNVSVELNEDYEVNGQKYPQVLTGLALLGADLPAIEGLGGITALYHSLHLAAEEGARIIVTTTDNTRVDLSTQPGEQPDSVKESEMTDLKEVRGALGLDDEGDPIAAIAGLKEQILTLQSTIASDVPDKGEVATLKAQLSEANQNIISLTNESKAEMLALRQRVHNMEAESRVDKAIAVGRITPANRAIALEVALGKTDDEFNRFVASLPKVDFNEHGTAGSFEMEAYEPTATEIAIAKSMGNWDEADEAGSRLRLMRAKGAKFPAKA